MVKLTSVVLGRPPHLIYGVKRGKVPTSLRPNVILKKQALGSKYFKCFRQKCVAIKSLVIDRFSLRTNTTSLVNA